MDFKVVFTSYVSSTVIRIHGDDIAVENFCSWTPTYEYIWTDTNITPYIFIAVSRRYLIIRGNF